MKDTLLKAWDDFLEKLKASLQEQQEREWYIRLKERYELLPLRSQRVVKFSGIFLILSFLLWIPVTNLMDASDLTSYFDERRESLKELIKIEREYSSVPFVPTPPVPMAMRSQLDQKVMAAGIKLEQIQDVQDHTEPGGKFVERKGVIYTINHVTLRQALDVAYEMEQSDKSLRLSDFQLDAEAADPHFYKLKLKLINFVPKSGGNS